VALIENYIVNGRDNLVQRLSTCDTTMMSVRKILQHSETDGEDKTGRASDNMLERM
jgi:hypothetical protein